MNTNIIILDFIRNNWIALLFICIFFRIIPSHWGGGWKYNYNDKQQGLAPKITILGWLMDVSIRNVFIPLLSSFGLRNSITFILFIVVGFDLFFRHQMSTQAITVVGIGIIALYLESLIEKGKVLKIFGLLVWEKDKD